MYQWMYLDVCTANAGETETDIKTNKLTAQPAEVSTAKQSVTSGNSEK